MQRYNTVYKKGVIKKSIKITHIDFYKRQSEAKEYQPYWSNKL